MLHHFAPGPFTLQAVHYGPNGCVTVLGGSRPHDNEAWTLAWNVLAGAANVSAPTHGLALVKATVDGEVVDRLPVDAPTAERLLGKPLNELIERGKHQVPLSLEALLARADSSDSSEPIKPAN